eukprot:TRINITY_DN0_c1920_g1_i1.p1 TRINITY_DN0_c1920_g1~~TRINITY_DN0_c1920_g1_i1.p1  ORF type:complete len:162 (-),score=33.52 TRINITY_DN0_c1920_g1_i1:91-576(-)
MCIRDRVTKKAQKVTPVKKTIKKVPKKVTKIKKQQAKEIEKVQSKPTGSLWIGVDLDYEYILENAKNSSVFFSKTYQTYLTLPKVNSSGLPDDEKKLIDILKIINSPTACYLPQFEKSKAADPINKQFPIIQNKLHIYNDQQNCVSWLYDQKKQESLCSNH